MWKDIYGLRWALSDGIFARVEQAFSEWIGGGHALFTGSGRAALYLAYRSSGLQGDVLVSPLTCSMALMPMLCAGLRPKFVDVDPATLNMNPTMLEAAISNKTCAVQVVHLGGNPCEMDKILRVARQYRLKVIEDCAQALGAAYGHRKVGSWGDAACFSLSKNFHGVGGGVLISENAELIERSRVLQMTFPTAPRMYDTYRLTRNAIGAWRGHVLGDTVYAALMAARRLAPAGKTALNSRGRELFRRTLFRPSRLQASVAHGRLSRLEETNAARNAYARQLSDRLRNLPQVRLQQPTPGASSVAGRFLIVTASDCRELIEHLNKLGVEARHLSQEYGRTYQERFDLDPDFACYPSIHECPDYFSVHDRVVSLPVSSTMLDHEPESIVSMLRGTLESVALMDGNGNHLE